MRNRWLFLFVSLPFRQLKEIEDGDYLNFNCTEFRVIRIGNVGFFNDPKLVGLAYSGKLI